MQHAWVGVICGRGLYRFLLTCQGRDAVVPGTACAGCCSYCVKQLLKQLLQTETRYEALLLCITVSTLCELALCVSLACAERERTLLVYVQQCAQGPIGGEPV